jgi:voltage-gated potassium channel
VVDTAAEERTATDAERLARFEQVMAWPILLSALVPILFALGGHDGLLGDLIMIVSWGVFIADLVVHVRWRPRYLHTGWGRFDLLVVVVTAPWFLVPGWGNARFVTVARLARLVRVVKAAGRSFGRLAEHLGKVGLFTAGLIGVCAYLTYLAEHPVNDEFATYGDALWWATVTMTTVGYGDIVPITQGGRSMGTILMFAGVGVLGVLAGALASFFGFNDAADGEEQDAEAASEAAADGDDLAVELAALRAQVAALDQAIASIEARRPA